MRWTERSDGDGGGGGDGVAVDGGEGDEEESEKQSSLNGLGFENRRPEAGLADQLENGNRRYAAAMRMPVEVEAAADKKCEPIIGAVYPKK